MGRLGLAVALSLVCIVGACMAVIAMMAFGYMALYFYMTTVTTPALAALTVAGLALFLAILLILGVSLVPRPSLLSLLADETQIFGRVADAMDMGRHLGAEGREFMRKNVSGGSIAAFSFGVAMGINPKLRKAVFRFLRGR